MSECLEKQETIKISALPYQKPELKELGDLRTLTLGLSCFTGESGNSTDHAVVCLPED